MAKADVAEVTGLYQAHHPTLFFGSRGVCGLRSPRLATLHRLCRRVCRFPGFRPQHLDGFSQHFVVYRAN